MKLLVVAALLICILGCVDRASQTQAKITAEFLGETTKSVSTVAVTSEALTQTLEVSGEITAGEDTTLSPIQPGRIAAVYVQDGDPVKAGQLLARQDTTAAQDQLRQARASLAQAIAAEDQARSLLVQAERNAAVGPQKTSSSVRQAKAQLRAAKAAYDRVVSGARPEERRQAEANAEAARVALETQEKELRRTERLVDVGAVAGKELDTQKNAVAAARATYENALQNLRMLQNGSRKEDIDEAHEQVKQAEEAVRLAEAEKRLDPLLKDSIDSAKAQVRNAQAQAESAHAQISIAEKALRDTEIRAPFAGKVSGRPVQVGTVADGGTAIARVVGESGLYFNGQLPSSKASDVLGGMAVVATADGLRGVTLTGKVAAISPTAQGVGRLLDVRIQLLGVPAALKSGMFVKGQIIAKKIFGTVVPTQAVMTTDRRSYVFTVRNGAARSMNVSLGISDGKKQQVRGLSEGDIVVVQGQESLTDGDKLRIEKPTDGGVRK